MTILLAILKFLPGFEWLAKLGLKFYETKLAALNNHEQKTLELGLRELRVQETEIKVQGAYKTAMLGKWYTVENILGYTLASYYVKAIFVDNVIGGFMPQWGLSTPALHGETAVAAATIMTFWMGKRGIENVLTIWKS